MKLFALILFANASFADLCPNNPDGAFQRFEHIQSVNGVAHSISGKLLVTIQKIEGSVGQNGQSIPNGPALHYTVDHEIKPGISKKGSVIPYANSPSPQGKFTYGVEKLFENADKFARALAKDGVTATAVPEKFKPQSYLSKSMFHVSPASSDVETITKDGRNHKVYRYTIKPKSAAELQKADEKRDPAQFGGEIWLDADKCMPLFMTGALQDTAWARVDKFEVDFALRETGFYPTRIYIRTFVTWLSWGLTGAFSFGRGAYQPTEMTITYIDAPNFRPVHFDLLQRMHIP